MPKRMRCPGCQATMIPVVGDSGQLNCRECSLLVAYPMPEPDEPPTRTKLRKPDGTLTIRGRAVAQQTRDGAKAALLERLREYIEECEGQMGLEYWLNFADSNHLLSDFGEYLTTMELEKD